MITLTNIDGRRTHAAPEAIATITEAGPSSQWHGVRSIVRLFDGRTIEARETADELLRLVATATR